MMKNMEIDDEDIPDEFLDPIMSTLIKNPMVIPGTNNTFMDKTVIYKYLMTDFEVAISHPKLGEMAKSFI